MSALRGAIAGALGLTMLQVLVSNQAAAQNASGLFTLTAGAVRRMVDPSVPLIPDLRGK